MVNGDIKHRVGPVSTLADGAVGKVVHLHCDGKVLQVVQELEKRPKLFKSDSL